MMKIAISGLNNTDNPAPGIPVAKSLQEAHTLVGLSYDVNEPGNYMGLVEKVYMMPYPSLGLDELLKRLAYIKERSGIEAVIPNLDAELPLYIKYSEKIEELGLKLCVPSLENFELRNKNKLGKLSSDLGIVYPKTYEIASILELEKIAKEKKFPLMIKGNYYKAYKAYNLDSAIEYFYKISNEWGFPILVQEVVQGEEINLVGVADGEGTLCGALSMKKLTTTEIGKIWTGITIKNDRLMQIAKDFVAKTKWRGPFELECMSDGNEVYLIEINPRFPAWVYFATDIGINLPMMVTDIMQGKKITPKTEYPLNKMYVRYTGEFVTDFGDLLQLLSTKEL